MFCKGSRTQGYHRDPTQIPNASHHWLQEYSIKKGAIAPNLSSKTGYERFNLKTFTFTGFYAVKQNLQLFYSCTFNMYPA